MKRVNLIKSVMESLDSFDINSFIDDNGYSFRRLRRVESRVFGNPKLAGGPGYIATFDGDHHGAVVLEDDLIHIHLFKEDQDDDEHWIIKMHGFSTEHIIDNGEDFLNIVSKDGTDGIDYFGAELQ